MSGRQSYGGATPMPLAPAPDISTAGLGSRALAAGMAEVSQSFSGLWSRLDQARAVNEAAGVVAQKSMDLADLATKAEQDADPATLPQRFRDSIAAWRAKAVEGLPNDVAAHVGRTLDGMIPAAYRQVEAQSTRRTIEGQRATATGVVGDHAQVLAAAADEPTALAQVGAIKAAIAGNVAAGVFDQPAGQRLFSHAIRQAVTIRAAADPIGAQRLLDRWRGEMDAGDVAALTTGLRAPLERVQAENAATAAIALTTETRGRAQAVIDGLIARGWSPTAAVGLAANAVQESGANPAVRPGDGGRSDGLFQWNGPRREAFRSRYGMDPSQAPLSDQLDFATWELQNTEGKAGDAIRAATTPGEAARLASTLYLRPRDTAAEEPRRAAYADLLAGGPNSARVRDAAVADVRTRLADAPLHVRLSAESLVAQHFAHQHAALQQERALLHQDVADLNAAYQSGATQTPIPEARIRATLEPEQAARTIQSLTISRTAGDAFRAVAFATPQEESDMRARLAVAGSTTSEAPRRVGGQIVPPTAASGPEDPALAAQRLSLLARYDQAVAAKREALRADPAAYVAAAPEVAPLAQAANDSPQAFAAYAAASAAAQQRMGLRDSQVRLLGNAQVANIAETLTKTDPSRADMGAVLAQQAQAFGPAWPRVFGELVQHGKISPAWQLLGAMDRPEQTIPRQDFQRALAFMATKGGMQKLREDAPPDELKTIRTNLDGTIADFRETARYTQGGLDLINTVRDGVELLAIYRTVQGMKASKALETAYDDIIGKKYDTAGSDHSGTFSTGRTMLVPKGKAADVEAATRMVQSNLTAADLEPLPGGGPLTPAERDASTLAAALRGIWITNEDASGAILMARARNGDIAPLRRRDGTRIEVKYDGLPKAAPQISDPMGTNP